MRRLIQSRLIWIYTVRTDIGFGLQDWNGSIESIRVKFEQ